MIDPRKILTEEIPETPNDYNDRRLTELGGEIRLDKRKALTEIEPVEEDEADNGKHLLLG